jgi:uncharacterized protein YbjT (DUF2867 family)
MEGGGMATEGLTVVAGSLGDQGGAVARALHRHARPVRALSHNLRSPAATRLLTDGVDVLEDDLDVGEVVVRDLAGATGVFGALTPFDKGGLEAETRQVRNLAYAAVQAGVRRFVYSAVGDPEQDRDVTADAIWGVERLVQEFELPLTLLRPAFFMENLDEFALRRDPDGTLVLRMPLDPRTTVQWIAVDDVGELVRLALERPELFGSGPVELAADELTLEIALAMVGDELDADVRYEQISLDDVTDQHAHGMYRWFQSYAHYDADMEALRRLHPGMLTFRQWLEKGCLDQSKLEERPAA